MVTVTDHRKASFMEPVRQPEDLRYGSILSSMDILDGAGELAQLAARIASNLESSNADKRNKAD